MGDSPGFGGLQKLKVTLFFVFVPHKSRSDALSVMDLDRRGIGWARH